MSEAVLGQVTQEKPLVDEGPYALFLDAVRRVEAGEVQLIELVTFVRNPLSGESQVYSALAGRVADPEGPRYPEHALNAALTRIIAELTGDPNGRQDLSGHLRERADYRTSDYDFGFETQFHEWPAVTRGVVLGVKYVFSDRGVLERTWYVAGATVRERSLSKNQLLRAVQLWLDPGLREPVEEIYHPSPGEF